WQVTDEASRISVNGSAYQTLRLGLCSTHSSGAAARMEKNIANRPAKNNSSLESHTIVPTATMVGRFSERTGLTIPGAAVTRSLWLPLATRGRRGRELAAAGGTRTPFPVPGDVPPRTAGAVAAGGAPGADGGPAGPADDQRQGCDRPA